MFLGILVFGRSRVSRKLYFISALCVFAGAHLSAFWIVAAATLFSMTIVVFYTILFRRRFRGKITATY